MSQIRSRGEKIRRFILGAIEAHPTDIAKLTADKFAISRQAVNKHLKRLVEEQALECEGDRRGRSYKLRPLAEEQRHFPLRLGLTEDAVWRDEIAPLLSGLAGNVFAIWQYCFTEMFNNAIDHSSGSWIAVHLRKTATATRMTVIDDGEGIFKKIKAALGLADERHSVLELAKGKLTTDPARHSGEGIFFTSKMLDSFAIYSGGVYFSHDFESPDYWIQKLTPLAGGTAVTMALSNHTSRTLNKVFGKFSVGDELGFSKTVVPVRLAELADDKLISRSQAKRLLARIDRFSIVVLDFEKVDTVGQGFADEVFRVFKTSHPQIELVPINMNSSVKRMVLWVTSQSSA